jgi:hypothetical protein
MERDMLHDEMILVVPVIAATVASLVWILGNFRGYLRRRDLIVAGWDEAEAKAAAPVPANDRHVEEHARAA